MAEGGVGGGGCGNRVRVGGSFGDELPLRSGRQKRALAVGPTVRLRVLRSVARPRRLPFKWAAESDAARPVCALDMTRGSDQGREKRRRLGLSPSAPPPSFPLRWGVGRPPAAGNASAAAHGGDTPQRGAWHRLPGLAPPPPAAWGPAACIFQLISLEGDRLHQDCREKNVYV